MKLPQGLMKMLKDVGLYDIVVCGSLRRGIQSTHDIDLMARGQLSQLAYCPEFIMLSNGEKRVSFMYRNMKIEVYHYQPEYKGAMMMHLTGPAQYNMWYRVKAKKQGMLLNQYGLWKGNRRVAGLTEESIYNALGKEYKCPEERGK